MIPFLIAGLIGVVGTVAALANWDKFTSWLKDDFIPKIKKFWAEARKNIAHAGAMFAELVNEGGKWVTKYRHKMYWKEDNHWMEETTTRTVEDADSIPDYIKAKVNVRQKEIDVTREMEENEGLELDI